MAKKKTTTKAKAPAGAERSKAPASKPNNALPIYAEDGDLCLATAKGILGPSFRHGATACQLHKAQFGTMETAPGIGDYAEIFRAAGAKASKGELELANRLLAAQALTLDNIFTEMARRMALNMGEYLPATETYARIAMKAQAQSRATLEALAKLHQPREQTVRHVHVNEGGQAVIADQFHNHTGGQQNGGSDEQSHGAATGAAGVRPALLGADPCGNGVPIPSREGPDKVPNARRDESGST
jgi:hypothetical protein